MKIEFIIPTYNRTNHLMCLLNSLCSQRSEDWVAHVIADCPPEGTIDKVMKYFEGDDRIKFTILPKRYNDWGHTPRNIGLQMANEEWVVMTGEDNYYVPVFVDNFLTSIKNNPESNFVYCDMVHNWGNFDYIHLKSVVQYGRIDIGNFASKTKFAKQLKLDTTIAQSDWLFIDEYVKKFPSTVTYIPKTLYIHN